jgi:hypothetical protein
VLLPTSRPTQTPQSKISFARSEQETLSEHKLNKAHYSRPYLISYRLKLSFKRYHPSLLQK